MTRLLCNDLVINEDSCNLSCQYCLTGQSNLKSSHQQQLIFSPPRRGSLNNSALRRQLDVILDRFEQLYDPPMLKITGGEVFMIEGIDDFIVDCSQRYRRLIVQTNGVVASDGQISRIEQLPNVVVQISLDSHCYTGNSYRVTGEKQHVKVMERIGRFFKTSLPLEIYCVINDRSIETLCEFAGYLDDQPNHSQLTPFPVRGPDSEKFALRPDQLQNIHDFVALHGNYPQTMPPKAYLSRLVSFYANTARTFGCHLPQLVASTFSDGMLTACPNIWFSDAGNLLDDDWQKRGDEMLSSGLRQALLAPKPRLSACKGCFTPWDTLSMYLDGELSLGELCRSHAYTGLEGLISSLWPAAASTEMEHPCP